MPTYTNIWNDSTPLGTAAANTIDDIFRALKVDIEQRISDLHGISSFTTDPLETQYVRVGYGTSTKGGFIKYTDDTGAYRWYGGIGNSLGAGAGTKDFIIYDVVNSATRLRIDNATGRLLLSSGLTASDTIAIYGAAPTSNIFQAAVSGDLNTRYYIQTDGKLSWGDGTSVSDTNLYRASAAVLKTDASFIISGSATFGADIFFAASSNIGTSGARFGAAFGASLNLAGDATIAALSATTGTFTSTLVTAPSAVLGWNGESLFHNSSDGVVYLTNNAASNYGTLTLAKVQFNGITSSFPSLKSSGATLQVRLADDSNFANLTAATITGAFVGALTGNASTATALQTARNINGVPFNGTANITITANTTQILTFGTHLTGGNFDGSAPVTIATDATSANTASTIVSRDASGNFVAGTITAALTGNASTATILQTARNINGTSFDGSANITVTAAAGTLTGTTLNATVVTSSLTSVGTLASLAVTGNVTAGGFIGNASTATALATARNINGVAFDGTGNITVTADANTLSGTTLATNVLASSLTSVGTLTSLAVTGAVSASKIYGSSSTPTSSSLATGVASITFASGSNNMHGSIIITTDSGGGSIAAGTTLGTITYANAYVGTPAVLLFLSTGGVLGSTLAVGVFASSNTGFSIYVNFNLLRNGTTTTIPYHVLGN